MKYYKYQMHMHTLPCSKCARMDFDQLLKALASGGYSGGVITNHFFHGNTGIERRLPWKEFVDAYAEDFEFGKKIARKYDLDLLFGLEEGVGQGKEILCYGIMPEFLYAHPELRKSGLEQWSASVRAAGGVCLQAHPFRHRDYISKPGLLELSCIDGIEAYNACNDFADNLSALEFAQENPGMIFVSGADAHAPDKVCCAGIETRQRIADAAELVQVLQQGCYRMITEEP